MLMQGGTHRSLDAMLAGTLSRWHMLTTEVRTPRSVPNCYTHIMSRTEEQRHQNGQVGKLDDDFGISSPKSHFNSKPLCCGKCHLLGTNASLPDGEPVVMILASTVDCLQKVSDHIVCINLVNLHSAEEDASRESPH